MMCSEYWRVRPGRAVSLRQGTGHRVMGQIMLRLIRIGSMFVGLEQREKEEGSKEGRGEERKEEHTVPPRLSLSAGFTWIGLFICYTEKEKRREESQTDNRGRRDKKKKTRDKETS